MPEYMLPVTYNDEIPNNAKAQGGFHDGSFDRKLVMHEDMR
jgi:hypothetical protein